MELPEVHSLRLHRIQHIDAGFDQRGDQLRHPAAGVIKDHHIGIDGLCFVDDPLQPGHEPFLIEADAHHNGMLHTHIIAQEKGVGAGFGEGPGLHDSHIGHFVQQRGGHVILCHHVAHQVLHAPHIPGPFPDGGRHVSHGGAAGSVDGSGPLLHGGENGKVKYREGIIFDLLHGVESVHGMVHIGHVVGRFRARFVGHAPIVDNGAWFEIFAPVVFFQEHLLGRPGHGQTGQIVHIPGNLYGVLFDIGLIPPGKIRTHLETDRHPLIACPLGDGKEILSIGHQNALLF